MSSLSSLNSNTTKQNANSVKKSNIEEEIKPSKYIKEMEEYAKLINEMYIYHIRESRTENNLDIKTDNNKKELLDRSARNAKTQSQKVIQYENSENKHIFQQIIQKAVDNLIDKNSLNVLTDEITNEEVNGGNRRIEILLNKLMSDKYLINDNTFTNNTNDMIISQVYLALSPDSIKLMLDSYHKAEGENDQQSFFHHLINFNNDKFIENPCLNINTLSSINNNIIKIHEIYNSKEESESDDRYDYEEMNYNLNSNYLEDVMETKENKLVFEEDRLVDLQKDYEITTCFNFTIEESQVTKTNIERGENKGVLEILTSNEVYNSEVNLNLIKEVNLKVNSNSTKQTANKVKKIPSKILNIKTKNSKYSDDTPPKKKIIKIEKENPKFTNFDDEDSDW